MPVAQQDLEARIDEIAGGDAEFRKTLLETIGARPEVATKFVNGFLGKADVTRKQQEIADQRKQLEGQHVQFQQQLEQAEADKLKIMRDLRDAKISAATANEMLQSVKTTYALNDEDIPTPHDVRQTANTGRIVDSTPDIDERLKTFKTDLMKEIGSQLVPELSALSALGPLWDDIGYEHEKLYGKRLTKSEKMDLIAEARKTNTSLENTWQEKFNVSEKRQEVHDKDFEVKLRQKWDDEQTARNSELALESVRGNKNRNPLVDDSNRSPIFKTKLEPPKDDLAEAAKATEGGGAPPIRRTESRGGQRAAEIYMERKMNGQLGRPIETRP